MVFARTWGFGSKISSSRPPKHPGRVDEEELRGTRGRLLRALPCRFPSKVRGEEQSAKIHEELTV